MEPAESPPAAPSGAADPPLAAPTPSGRPVRIKTRPAGTLGRVATGLAVLALVAYAVAAALFLIPVETPGVQDCGAPAAYLLDGRFDVVPDAEGRIRNADGEVVTLDPEVAEEARTNRCQQRVADRAVPAGILVLNATTIGMIAFSIELFVIRPRLRHALTTPPDER